MRRLLFPILGLVELTVAFTMLALGVSLPGQDDVRRSFDGVQRVTVAAGNHVRGLREEVGLLRRSRLRQTADRLQASTRTVTAALGTRRIDFDRVRIIRDAMESSASGLDGLAAHLDPDALSQLGQGLGDAADFLDRKVVPATARAADEMEAASNRLQVSARRFGRIAEAMPLDFAPIREVHESLGRFDEGLAAMSSILEPTRLVPLREATSGAEGAVTEAARLAERTAGYTYPVVELDGLRPTVRTRPFWPRGAEIGADLRKVAGGVTALGREIEALSRELPKVQAAMAESRKIVAASRKSMAIALRRQEEVEPLLKDMSEQATRLAEELPRITGDLSGALRNTGKLSALAATLRQAQAETRAAVTRWPEVRAGLAGSATLLRASRDQLDGVLQHRAEYEAAQEQIEGLSTEFAGALPAVVERLDGRLDEEDRTLAEMARGIEQVDAVLPAYSRALSRSLRIGQLLACLVAVVAGLHGCTLIAGIYPGRRRRWAGKGSSDWRCR
jgi:hypothetical protein